MFKKSLIFSIILLTGAKLNCMEEKNNAQLDTNNNNAVVANQQAADAGLEIEGGLVTTGNQAQEERCWIIQMPSEVLLSIIKHCLENSNNEQELQKTILRLSKLNRLFKNLVESNNVLKFVFNKLEKIKNLYTDKDHALINWKSPAFDKDSIKAIKSKLLFDIKGLTAHNNKRLLDAAKNGQSNIVLTALANGAEIDVTNRFGWTALMLSADNGHKNIVQILIENGANLEAKDEYLDGYTQSNLLRFGKGWTALMFAAQKGHSEIIKLLIQNQANINAYARTYGTALMIATSNDRYSAVKLLLENGANPDIRCYGDYWKDEPADGITALYIAKRNKNQELVALLSKYQKDACTIS